jgi:hypothetical protein
VKGAQDCNILQVVDYSMMMGQSEFEFKNTVSPDYVCDVCEEKVLRLSFLPCDGLDDTLVKLTVLKRVIAGKVEMTEHCSGCATES